MVEGISDAANTRGADIRGYTVLAEVYPGVEPPPGSGMALGFTRHPPRGVIGRHSCSPPDFGVLAHPDLIEDAHHLR